MELFKTAKGIMTKGNFITTSPKAKVRDVAIAMISGEITGLPVIDDDRKVIGIITEFDIIRAIRKGKNIEGARVEDIMTKNPITIGENTSIDEIINVLETKHIIRVPVVDKDGKLVGIVARRDVLKGITEFEGAPQIWL